MMPPMKKGKSTKSFHLRYLELCKSKNIEPVPEVKVKNKEFNVLEFFGDRVKVDDWHVIFNALNTDTSLQHIAIKLRKNYTNVIKHSNALKKPQNLNGQPVFISQQIFSQFIDTISHMLYVNERLTTLMLEGLPLRENYITYIAKGLSNNSTVRNLSFARSALGDVGCEIICSTVKYLSHIECLNLSQCQLSENGAKVVADLIKFQKIVRYAQGWENTLRSRTIDPDILPGLNRIALNSNSIKDEGLYFIMDVLKEDCWIKGLDVQNCDITDEGAKFVIDCLSFNNTLLMIDLKQNLGISAEFIDHIRMQMGLDSEDSSSNGEYIKEDKQKASLSQMRERVKFLEQQLETEVFRRKKSEELNQGIQQQLFDIQKQLATQNTRVPDGYILVEADELANFVTEHDHLRGIVSRMSQTRVPPTQLLTKLKKSRGIKKPAPVVVDKTKSEIIRAKPERDHNNESKSQCYFPIRDCPILPFVERNIGDTHENIANSARIQRSEEQVLKIFMKRRPKQTPVVPIHSPDSSTDGSDEVTLKNSK